MMLLLTMALFMSCGDDDEVKLPDTKDVNYANIAGTWRLSEWNGENLEGDTRYYYITFDRKEKDGKRSYTIYTNLNSATSEQIPGSLLWQSISSKYQSTPKQCMNIPIHHPYQADNSKYR